MPAVYNIFGGGKTNQKYKKPSKYLKFSQPQPISNRHANAGHSRHAQGWGQTESSPALSALALIGFLFFLNLIQNVLLLNRLLWGNQVIITGNNNETEYEYETTARAEDQDMVDIVGETEQIDQKGEKNQFQKYPNVKKLMQYFFPTRSITSRQVAPPNVQMTSWPLIQVESRDYYNDNQQSHL